MDQQEMCYVEIRRIRIKAGFNPRKFFNDAKYRELLCSVREHGVIQPIIIRPETVNEGEYWIVAGERRFRAASEAGLLSIPAVIRDLTEPAAALIATIENTHRDDISLAEESEAARAVLAACENDRQEAMRLLGWTQARFDARLLLLHAAPEVLDALVQRKIKLGHAELLSQLPSDFQTATLERILEHGFTVADLKARLAEFAQDLSRVCFDTGECTGCPHNSQVQASLFEDHIDAGRCANRECFQAKTNDALAAKKAALTEHYAAVFLDTERPPNTYTVLCELGPQGVGKQQFTTGCRQCAHFGALLITAPDRLGQVKDDCCFNLECHAKKVAVHLPVTKPPAKDRDRDRDRGTRKRTPEATTPGGTSAGTPTKAIKGKQAAPAASAAALPGTVVENIHRFFRTLAAKIATDEKHSILCLNTFALFRALSSASPSKLLPDSVKTEAYKLQDLKMFLAAIYPLPAEEVIAFNHRLLGFLLAEFEKTNSLIQKTWASGAAALVRCNRTDLSGHFQLDRKFLEAFTKAGIEAVLREAENVAGERFVDFFEASGEKRKFTNLMKQKHGDILDEVFNCGYDFSGFVPSCVSAFLGDDGNAGATNIAPIITTGSPEQESDLPGEHGTQDSPDFEYTADPEDEDLDHDF